MATTLAPSTELLQQLNYLADDEEALKKVLLYVKRLVAKREEKIPARAVEDIRCSLKDIRQTGGAHFMSWEEFDKELQGEGY